MVELATLQAVSYIMGSLGVFVAAVYYVMNLRNTIDSRKAQLLMEYNRIWSSKEWLTDLHESLNYEWKDFDDFWNKYGHPNPEAHSRWISIANGMSYALMLLDYNLVSEDMLRRYLNYVSMGAFWEKFGPAIKEMRAMWNIPDMFQSMESYYNKWRKVNPLVGEQEYRVPD